MPHIFCSAKFICAAKFPGNSEGFAVLIPLGAAAQNNVRLNPIAVAAGNFVNQLSSSNPPAAAFTPQKKEQK
jgi:hypothetical protein